MGEDARGRVCFIPGKLVPFSPTKTWRQTQIKRLLRVSRLSIAVAVVNLRGEREREREVVEEGREKKDWRRSLLEEGRHVARLCCGGSVFWYIV